jgi:hypothetical protein
VYSSEVCFDVNWLFLFFSFFFFLGLRVGHVKNYINPSISFFFWFSPYSLNCNCFIYINFFYWILFLISSLFIWFC